MDGEDVGLLEVGADTDAGTGGEDTPVLPAEDVGDASGDGSNDTAADSSGQQDADKAEGDKRTLPVQVRNALRKFTQSNPDFAKEFPRFEKDVVGALFARQAINAMGGLPALNQLKETVELHGGVEGIQQMVEEVEASRELDKGFETGDPKVVEGYVRDYPEGFKKIIPTALNALAKNFPEDYNRVGSTILHNTLRNNNLYESVVRIGEALKAGDAKAAVADYDKLVDFLASVQKTGTTQQSDPYEKDRQEIEAQRQSIANERKTAFVDKVRSEVDPMIVRDVNKIVGAALKGRQMEVSARNRLMNEIRGMLANRVHNEPNYSRQWPGVRDAGDHGRAVKFNYAAYSKALPTVVSTVMKDPVWVRYFGGAQQRTVSRPAGERQVNTTVAGRPQIADVDFNRTDKATFLGSRAHGTAWLKSGKQAKW